MQETNEMHGRVTLWLTDSAGNVHALQRRENRIVTSGRRLVAQLFGGIASGTPPAKVTHMAVGTDATPPADNQTGLLAEVAGRKPITDVAYTEFTDTTGTTTAQRVRVSLRALFDFGDANSATPLREAGIFTAPSAGVMYNRVTFDAVTKTNAFQLTLLWEVVF
jgi:hypothetical protein